MYSSEDIIRLTGKLWAPLVCLKQKDNYIMLQDERGGYCGDVYYIIPGQWGVVIKTTYLARTYLREKLRKQGSSTFSPVLQYPI